MKKFTSTKTNRNTLCTKKRSGAAKKQPAKAVGKEKGRDSVGLTSDDWSAIMEAFEVFHEAGKSYDFDKQ